MLSISLIVKKINIKQLKGILWHTDTLHEINMSSSCSPSTSAGDWGLDKTVVLDSQQNTCVYRYILHITRCDDSV